MVMMVFEHFVQQWYFEYVLATCCRHKFDRITSLLYHHKLLKLSNCLLHLCYNVRPAFHITGFPTWSRFICWICNCFTFSIILQFQLLKANLILVLLVHKKFISITITFSIQFEMVRPFSSLRRNIYWLLRLL